MPWGFQAYHQLVSRGRAGVNAPGGTHWLRDTTQEGPDTTCHWATMRFQIFPDGSGVSTQRQSWIRNLSKYVQIPLAAFMHCTVHREETWRNHKKTTYWSYCKHWQRPFQTRQGVIFICKASDTFQLPTFDVVSQQWSPDTLVYIIMFPNLINPIGKPLGLFLPSLFSPISGQILGMIWFIIVPLYHLIFV